MQQTSCWLHVVEKMKGRRATMEEAPFNRVLYLTMTGLLKPQNGQNAILVGQNGCFVYFWVTALIVGLRFQCAQNRF